MADTLLIIEDEALLAREMQRRFVKQGWDVETAPSIQQARALFVEQQLRPLVILAAICFSRGAPRLEAWLAGSRLFGPILADWRANGAIAPRYKVLAVAMMAAVLVYSLAAGAPVWVLVLQAVLIAVGAAYVLSRPNGT